VGAGSKPAPTIRPVAAAFRFYWPTGGHRPPSTRRNPAPTTVATIAITVPSLSYRTFPFLCLCSIRRPRFERPGCRERSLYCRGANRGKGNKERSTKSRSGIGGKKYARSGRAKVSVSHWGLRLDANDWLPLRLCSTGGDHFLWQAARALGSCQSGPIPGTLARGILIFCVKTLKVPSCHVPSPVAHAGLVRLYTRSSSTSFRPFRQFWEGLLPGRLVSAIPMGYHGIGIAVHGWKPATCRCRDCRGGVVRTG
jgi:hypothetical protein